MEEIISLQIVSTDSPSVFWRNLERLIARLTSSRASQAVTTRYAANAKIEMKIIVRRISTTQLGKLKLGQLGFKIATIDVTVSYTHLTLPTNREV